MVVMAVRIGAKPADEEAACLASSSAMSMARQTREVRGMRWLLVACSDDVKRSHSSARACARSGFVRGMRMIALVVEWRRWRASRLIWYAPVCRRVLVSLVPAHMQCAVSGSIKHGPGRLTINFLYKNVLPEALLQWSILGGSACCAAAATAAATLLAKLLGSL